MHGMFYLINKTFLFKRIVHSFAAIIHLRTQNRYISTSKSLKKRLPDEGNWYHHNPRSNHYSNMIPYMFQSISRDRSANQDKWVIVDCPFALYCQARGNVRKYNHVWINHFSLERLIHLNTSVNSVETIAQVKSTFLCLIKFINIVLLIRFGRIEMQDFKYQTP